MLKNDLEQEVKISVFMLKQMKSILLETMDRAKENNDAETYIDAKSIVEGINGKLEYYGY